MLNKDIKYRYNIDQKDYMDIMGKFACGLSMDYFIYGKSWMKGYDNIRNSIKKN